MVNKIGDEVEMFNWWGSSEKVILLSTPTWNSDWEYYEAKVRFKNGDEYYAVYYDSKWQLGE